METETNGEIRTVEEKEPLPTLTESPSKPPMTKEERKAAEDKIYDHLRTLKGQELVDYVQKIDDAIPGKTDYRRQVWEGNHNAIGAALHNFINEYSRPPTKNELAEITLLSRQTVAAHLKEFQNTDFFKEERGKFKLLSHRVLSKVYEHARQGNMKAARLFFEITGEFENRTTKNYYIQVNNIRLNENMIKQLPKEAILQIEEIICKSIPQQLTTNENGNNNRTR